MHEEEFVLARVTRERVADSPLVKRADIRIRECPFEGLVPQRQSCSRIVLHERELRNQILAAMRSQRPQAEVEGTIEAGELVRSSVELARFDNDALFSFSKPDHRGDTVRSLRA